MEPKFSINGNGASGNGSVAMETEWEDWRQGECLLPQLVGE